MQYSLSLSRRTALAALAAAPVALAQVPAKRWYKGNLHTHTLNSDGDATPLEVATWYRTNGYQFLVLTDHNFVTAVGGLNDVIGADERFLLIRGEEVSDSCEKKPVHLNAFMASGYVAPAHGATVAETVQNNLDAIAASKGLASLNHPNFRWAVSAEDLLRINNLALIEVYNGHPTVNGHGGGDSPSTDDLWDTALTAGKRIYGVAVDDAHHYKVFSAKQANPGRGWVVVRTTALTAENIIAALAAGEFYASTGVIVDDIQTSSAEYRVQLNQRSDERFTTYFIGAGGKVLAKRTGLDAAYRLQGNEPYVRARIESSTGAVAWAQPWFRLKG